MAKSCCVTFNLLRMVSDLLMTLLFENRIYLLASIFHEDNDRGCSVEHLLPNYYANKNFLGY